MPVLSVVLATLLGAALILGMVTAPARTRVLLRPVRMIQFRREDLSMIVRGALLTMGAALLFLYWSG